MPSLTTQDAAPRGTGDQTTAERLRAASEVRERRAEQERRASAAKVEANHVHAA